MMVAKDQEVNYENSNFKTIHIPLVKAQLFPKNITKEAENITVKCHLLAQYNKNILNHFFIENSQLLDELKEYHFNVAYTGIYGSEAVIA